MRADEVRMFAELVHGYRQRLGLTQDELAEKASLSVRNLRNLEAGRTGSPRPATVRLLADVFELTGAERDSFRQAAAGAPVGEPTGQPTWRRAPAQLPPDVAGFTGRQDQLAHLDGLLADDADPPTAVLISAIAGTAGVGKTALALRWAHQADERFPDGQLYVNLRGYDPDRPMSPDEALAGFLAALGIPGQDVPVELDQRAARFRSEVAGARMLIVLDNAGSVEQVRPLLPGSGSCAVVVTSRDSLAGLVAVDGAHRLDLDLLPPADAVALLRRLIGVRVDAEPEAAATMAEQCARLPLALRIAAELATSRPTVPLADLAAELADHQRRLDLLDGRGDPHAAVRVVFSWSIRHLPPEAARTFALVGLHPGPDIDPYAVAALADSTHDRAQRTLELLAHAHLVHPTRPGRYGMHDLLRAYATHLATAHQPDRQHLALTRLFDHYLSTAAAAMDSWYPAETHRRPKVHLPASDAPDLTDPDSALAWLDAERPCLVAMAAHTATHGWPTHTTRLTSILNRYLDSGHYPDALTIHEHARHAAERAGDHTGQAHALRHLGAVHARQGRFELAIDHHRQALTRFRQAGDRSSEATTLDNLGSAEERLGHYEVATGYHAKALALYRQAGDRTGQAETLNHLGIAGIRLGHTERAAGHLAQALALYRQTGDRTGEASALNNLGCAEERLGRYRSAAEHYRQALDLSRQRRYPRGEAIVLESLGTLHLRLDQPTQATEHFARAVTISREIGDRAAEAEALNGLGEAAGAADRHADALTHHTDALTLTTETGARDQQARAHAGLGDALRALGHLTRARTHYERALALYADLEMPLAETIRTRLATLTAVATPG